MKCEVELHLPGGGVGESENFFRRFGKPGIIERGERVALGVERGREPFESGRDACRTAGRFCLALPFAEQFADRVLRLPGDLARRRGGGEDKGFERRLRHVDHLSQRRFGFFFGAPGDDDDEFIYQP